MKLALAHRRYTQQAAWTAPARRHLLSAAGLPNARGVLEVGCGTGAVLSTLRLPPGTLLAGMDIDRPALQLARQHAGAAALAAGDAHHLPYPDASFDIALCHFVLLWLAQPAQALGEMRRVVRRGGAVLALAEPDYCQRLDQPAELQALGQAQTQALEAQGADTRMGSQLPGLFAAAGLQLLDYGRLQTASLAAEPAADLALEAETLRSDLSGHVPPAQLEAWLAQDAAAWAAGSRRLHVPTYYALGRVA